MDPDTLRRWADSGRIEAFTTPGGHRRFARRALERVVASRRPGRLHLASVGATPDRLSRAYRRSYAAGPASVPTDGEGPDPDREAFRHDGRRLVEALLAHLDGSTAAARSAAEEAAGGLTDVLARRLAARGTPLPVAIELFVAARRPFLGELGAIARRRSLDPARLAAAYEDASALLDRLLLRLIATHQAAGA